jgi:hypothetical protein
VQERVNSYRMRQAQRKRAEAPRCGAREARHTRARCAVSRAQSEIQRTISDVEATWKAKSRHKARMRDGVRQLRAGLSVIGKTTR